MQITKSILFIVLLFTVSAAWAAPVDVTDFGAIGDGSNPDGPAIQLAIDSLENSLTGGTVYFPPGLYNVSNTIYVPSNVRLQGTGSTLYNSQVRLMQPQRALFEVTDKGATNVIFKDLLLISMVGGWPRTDPDQTALIRTEGTVGISFKARSPGLSNLEVENVRIMQFTHGIAATGLTGFNAQITGVKIRNYVSDGNEYSLYTNTYGANDWDVQNMNVFPMYDKQNGIFLERSGQMRFLQLSCAGAGAETCAKLWDNGDTYFRQMHVEGARLGFCVGAHCRPTDPPGNMGENSSTLTVENSATNGEFHRLTNIVSVNNRFWLDFPQQPGPEPYPPVFTFYGTGADSSLKSCGNVWVSMFNHLTDTSVNIPPVNVVFPGLATDPITVCSNNDLTSVPVFNTGYDPDDERLEGEKDVRDYGAIADDDHDDFHAFKAAIKAAIRSRGRRVYVPPGRFDIYNPLILDRGVTIVGEIAGEKEPPSEIRLHGQGTPLFTIFNTPVENETLMQGIGFRNLLLTSESDDGTIGINFENYSPDEVGGSSDFHIQNVDFDGFGIGITVRPFGGVFENPNPMFDTVSIKDGDFTRNRTAILLSSANASHWNMEDIRVEIPAGGEGVRINRGGHASIRNLSCNGDTTATACVTIQRQTGTSIDNMTAAGVISALEVPWENGYTQFPVTIRNSNLLEGVYFQGRIYLNSVNNQYPAELGVLPFPLDRKVVRFGGFREGNKGNDYYGGQSDVFSCSDIFIDPFTQQTETRWTFTGVLEKRVTYCE
jgi:Pectate lyase superfamily protein